LSHPIIPGVCILKSSTWYKWKNKVTSMLSSSQRTGSKGPPLKNVQGIARRQWLTPIILATQKAEIRRIMVQRQLQQIVCETLSWKKLITKKGWWTDSWWRSWVQTPVPKKRMYKVNLPRDTTVPNVLCYGKFLIVYKS
jgi:hypothetical protein